MFTVILFSLIQSVAAFTFWINSKPGHTSCYSEEVPTGTVIHGGGKAINPPNINLNYHEIGIKLEIIQESLDHARPHREIIWTYNGNEGSDVRFTTASKGDSSYPLNITLCATPILARKEHNVPQFSTIQLELLFDVGAEAGDYSNVVAEEGMEKVSAELMYQHNILMNLSKELSELRHRDFNSEGTTDMVYTYIRVMTLINCTVLIIIAFLEVYSFRGFLKKKKII